MKKIFLAIALLISSTSSLAAKACDVQFPKHNICARIVFNQPPVTGTNSPFTVYLEDQQGQLKDQNGVFVDLWMQMGNHGHGSSPLTITKKAEATYFLDKAYFVMRGEWQIRITLENGAPSAEQGIFKVTVK